LQTKWGRRFRLPTDFYPLCPPNIGYPLEVAPANPELKAFELLAAGNVPEAAATITSALDAQAAMDALARLCKQAYRDLKSVPAMTALAWEAIGFGVQCAATSPSARAIAYNTAANCWPGWGDPVEIKPADIAEGLKLAERNYQLVVELGLGDKAAGCAFWLIGALRMAAGDSPTAIVRFRNAEAAFRAAKLPAQESMARGYAALAAKLQPHPGGPESLDAALSSLRAMEFREAQFFADQLVTAERIFSAP